MLGNKINHNTFKIIEIIQGMLSEHNGIKLETDNKNSQIFGNYTVHIYVTHVFKKKSQEKLENILSPMKIHILELWDAAKAVLKGKLITINVYIKKKPERSQSNRLTLHLWEIEEKQTKPKSSMRKEILE